MCRCAPAIAGPWAFLPLAFAAAAVLRPLALLLAFLAFAAVTQSTRAATVGIVVTDLGNRPLLDAVVMLEPASGRLPVSPMSGVQIAQMQRQFTPQVTVVTVGTPVTFPNNDTVRHHVYSFSPVKTFELKLYAGVPASPVVFDKPGIAVLGCNIHDQMVAWVVVVDTPLYARSAASGRAQIEGVAPGAWQLHVWHASLADGAPPVLVPLTVAASDVDQRVKLGAGGSPR